MEMVKLGADVIDVGAESTRPASQSYGAGYSPLKEDEEKKRLTPFLEHWNSQRSLDTCDTPLSQIRLSIDTTKTEVAGFAIRHGASIVNDVSCAGNASLLSLVRESGVEYVLMHNRLNGGEHAAVYSDVITEVAKETVDAAKRLEAMGIEPKKIMVDPGLGFAKTREQSMTLLAHLDQWKSMVEEGLGHSIVVLVGASRKRFLALEDEPPKDRVIPSVAALCMATGMGATHFRVHDVQQSAQALRTIEQIHRQKFKGTSPDGV